MSFKFPFFAKLQNVIGNSQIPKMKIQEGEVFTIRTKVGYGFFQYLNIRDLDVEISRVLEPVKETNKISQEEVNLKERHRYSPSYLYPIHAKYAIFKNAAPRI